MDLDLAPEDREFREELRTWLKANVPERWRRSFAGGEDSAQRIQLLRRWQRRVHEAGYVGIGWPRKHGGRDASLMQQTLLGEEFARAKAPPLVGTMGVQMLGPTLIQWGGEAQQQRFLPKILTADEIWCQGYSEPGAGSDLASLKTSAVRDGGHFVVNGQKIWTSNAQVADWMFCLVRTDPSAPKHGGISYLLIDMNTPGISVRPLIQMTKDAGFNEVFLDDVHVPAENLVGGLNNGWAVANTTLFHERNMLASTTNTRNLLNGLLRVARQTQRNGRPAREDPIVRQRLADLKIQVEAMRFHSYRALTSALKGKPPGIEASITKLATCELNHQIASTAVEVLGMLGPLYRGSRHVRDKGFWSYELMWSLGIVIGGGTAQIQKNIIAQRGLGLPRGK
jgi:alkylation response protein AidB-like acyl-CoA dehydrogenase